MSGEMGCAEGGPPLLQPYSALPLGASPPAVQHSQLLQALAGDAYTRNRASSFLAGDPAHVASARAALPNVVDIAFAEAAASATAGAGTGTHGSGGSQRSVSSGAASSIGAGGSFGAAASGPAALLGPPPSFNTILKRVSAVLSARVRGSRGFLRR
jgi:hypothetical protein